MSINSLTVNRTPDLIAAEINSIKDQTRTMLLYNSIEIGRRLIEAKALVPHGEWGTWLENSVDYSQRTANNLMKISQEYGSGQVSLFGEKAKSQALANLNYTQALALLSVPEEERDQFAEENDIANMSSRELQQAIKERDEALKKVETAEQIVVEKSEETRKLQEEKDQLQSDKQVTEQSLKDTKETVKQLQEKLQKQREEAGSEEKVKQLEADLQNALDQVEDLKNQLAEPVTIEAAAIEKIPEAVEQELEDLRTKNQQLEAKANQSKEIMRFGVCFDNLVSDFQLLLAALETIKEAEPESHATYRKAVSGLIARMNERL